MSAPSDRNLLLGILALQMDFVTREQLVAAMHAWVLEKSKPLDQVLFDQGALRTDTQALLAALVAKHLEMHAGDAQQSLAAVSSVGSLREELKSLADPDVEASLSIAGAARDPNATLSWSVGAATSAGQRFRILRPHARGGLGQVSVALDSELSREVALKEILTAHADDPVSRSRFLLEAEITGGLEHPGIVPVYGLGQYADGRPFYAMRFIKGDSLKEAIDRFHAGGKPDFHGVAFRQLLGRFIDVCNAVAYAHSRGVLHRDLKPGNIMLGKYGETLVVDWGLAKATGRKDASHDGAEATLRPASASGSAPTLMGSAVGTPAFMSPEQAAGRLDEVGPATDVYSLGATLYYVLTGRPPFERDDVPTVLRRVQAGDLRRPREVKPDIPFPLQAVCLKAMALQPGHRYPAPRELSDDLERYLADEPVAAHPEPVWARTLRWLRKHPRTVSSLAAALLVGLTSAVVVAAVVSSKNQQLATANANLRAANAAERRAKQDAETKRQEAEGARAQERLARGEAQRSADEARAVLGFFQDRVLAAARPADYFGGLGVEVTVRQALDAAEPAIAESFPNQPLVEATIRHTLGMTYRYLGETELTVRQHERARELRAAGLGPEHPDTVDSMSNLANAYRRAGRLNESLPLQEESLRLRRAILGPNHAQTLHAMNNVALTYDAMGRSKEALALHEATLKLRTAALGAEHPDTLQSLNNVALSYQEDGRREEALRLLEESLRIRSARDPEHPDTIAAMSNVANAYLIAGRVAEAQELQEKSQELMKTKMGKDHPDTARSTLLLAFTYLKEGRILESLPLFEEAQETLQTKLGRDHPETLEAMNKLGNAYRSAGRFSEAETLLEETLKLATERLGQEHPLTFTAMSSVGRAYSSTGRVADSVAMFEKVLALRKAHLGTKHPDTLQSMHELAATYAGSGKATEALPLFEETLRLRREKLGADDPDTLVTMSVLAGAYAGQRRVDEAIALLEKVLAARQAQRGAGDFSTLQSLYELAVVYELAERWQDAVTLREELLKQTKAKMGPDHSQTLLYLNQLAAAYNNAGRLEDALPLYEESLALRKAKLGPQHPDTVIAMGGLGLAYLQAKQFEKALPTLDQYVAGARSLGGTATDAGLAYLLDSVSLNLVNHEQYAAAEKYLRERAEITERAKLDDWSVFHSKSILGAALAGQGKLAEAEPQLLAGYEGMVAREEQIPFYSRGQLAVAVERLVKLYEDWAKPQEAANWKTKLPKGRPSDQE